MRDEHAERTERTEKRGQWPGPTPAAERKADELRENLRGAGPETTATSTRQDDVPDTAGAAARENGPGPVPAPEQAGPARPGSAPGAAAGDRSAWLFEPVHTEEFRRRWDAIKASFVDDPREAVRRADELTDELVRELTAAVESRRRELAGRWKDSGPAAADDDSETERLRVALRSYRNMLDPILRV
jgi:hypothetical protein